MDQNSHVETIRVVMEDSLLRQVDTAARRLKMNRSALIREALRRHIAQLQAREREDADRHGHERVPEEVEDLAAWNRVLAWPKD